MVNGNVTGNKEREPEPGEGFAFNRWYMEYRAILHEPGDTLIGWRCPDCREAWKKLQRGGESEPWGSQKDLPL